MASLIVKVIETTNIANNIFYHLSNKDLQQCALVNKTWYLAVSDARSQRKLELTVGLLDNLRFKNESLADHIQQNYKHVVDVDIVGWSKGSHIKNDVYDKLFTPQLKAKRLILRGRGCWDTCRCPAPGTPCGEQIDSVDEEQLTNLEYIHIVSTFCISACALLDLVARCPKLKVLKFFGILCKNDHHELFNRTRFHCDLEALYWPWPSKRRPMDAMTVLVKRNDNLVTLWSTADTVSDLLAADAVPNLRFLSLNLNEKWKCKQGKIKKVNKFLEKIQYLSQAKNIEALEVRTFDRDDCEDPETNAKVDRVYESYKIAFWEQVSKLPKLKFLAIYGSWEFEAVCREMAKNSIQLEYLKINLTPNDVASSIDAGEDSPVLSMADGIRNLKKLPNLKSLHFICYERLGSIDSQTVEALKEIMDTFWILDIKTGFTDEIEDLLNIVMRRGNQLGKTYKYYIHILSKLDSKNANIVTDRMLKYALGTQLRAKLASIAESETAQRYRKSDYESFHLWGLELIGNIKDKESYDRLASNWKLYNQQFYTDLGIL